MKTIVALAQIEIVLADVESNLQQAQQSIQQAAESGAELILFPELWTTGYDLPRRAELVKANQPVLAEIARLSAQYNITIGGSWITERTGDYFNTFHLVSPTDPVVTYDKTHLFGLMYEDQWLSAGGKLQTAAFAWGSAGLAVCYDLRFPEMFRKYTLGGANAVLIVAEWPLKRLSHWQTLLRARAIENQIFIFAVNAAGKTGGVPYGGASCVITPWGDTLVEAGDKPTLITAQVDFDLVEFVRKKMPALTDRRADLY